MTQITTTRDTFDCQRCGWKVLPHKRRATIKGLRVCWPCAEPFKARKADAS